MASAVDQEKLKGRSALLFTKHILGKIFLEDWITKLVALAITLALWLGVTGLSTPTTRRLAEIPLTLSYSNDTEITNSPVQAVSIVISGDKRKINQLTENDILISLDLSDVPPGDRVVQLTAANVLNLPLGVKVQEIQPNKIAVKLETVEERDIQVAPETQGDLPDGYELYGDPAVTPAKLRVRGPTAYVRSLSTISTDKILLTGHTSDFVARQVPVSIPNPKSTLIDSSVDVAFRIGEKRVERSFQVPVSDSPGKNITVVLFGARSVLADVTPKDLSVERVKDAGGTDTYQVVLPDRLRPGVQIRKPATKP